jgi:hypothetical protein
MRKPLTVCIYVNAILTILLSLYVFIVPVGTVIRGLSDPGLQGTGIPRLAFNWHRALSPKYEAWARDRVHSGVAADLGTENVAGTEWPLFGSVFYLWATEGLQEEWEQHPAVTSVAPKVYARGAIEAAAALVADPNHAGWVKKYWGEKYLEKENLFYRMLLISALTSYQTLLGDTRYEVMLRGQVESLARELDESPFGLLDDYPGQCFPVDIVPAIAAIRRADAVLGTDHSEFVARAIRGFQDTRLDVDTGLPAYAVRSRTGQAADTARGVGLSYMVMWAATLWPDTATQWYDRYTELFWQEDRWLAGFREFPRKLNLGWLRFEVDAGPVVAGYGVAASAFGIGAARAMGDADRAYMLSAQALAASWPLPNGTLLTPRILSGATGAPYLGESATLFALTRRPQFPSHNSTSAHLPAIVYVVLALLSAIGIYEIVTAWRGVTRWRRKDLQPHLPAPRLQLSVWAFLLASAFVVWAVLHSWTALIPLLTALVLPLHRRRRRAIVPAEISSERKAVNEQARDH